MNRSNLVQNRQKVSVGSEIDRKEGAKQVEKGRKIAISDVAICKTNILPI